MRVLFDSNVWVAAIATDGFCRRVLNALETRVEIVGTPYLLNEVAETLVFKFHRTVEQAQTLVENAAADWLLFADVPQPDVPVSDPDDKPILAAAVRYDCEFLVTGDKELLAVREFSGVKIVTVREFAERLRLPLM